MKVLIMILSLMTVNVGYSLTTFNKGDVISHTEINDNNLEIITLAGYKGFSLPGLSFSENAIISSDDFNLFFDHFQSIDIEESLLSFEHYAAINGDQLSSNYIETYQMLDGLDYISCKSILDAGDSTGDGEYIVDPDGIGSNPPFMVECDMLNGGWTKVATHSGQSGTSYFFSNSPSYYLNRMTTGSHNSNSADFISYAFFDLPISEIMIKRSGSGTPIQKVVVEEYSGKTLSELFEIVYDSPLVGFGLDLSDNLQLYKIYTAQIQLSLGFNSVPETESFYGKSLNSNFMTEYKLFSLDRNGSADPWHHWMGPFTHLLNNESCSSIGSGWAYLAHHPVQPINICNSTSDSGSVFVR